MAEEIPAGKPDNNKNRAEGLTEDSSLYGVSIRGWLAVIMVSTICAMSFFKIDVVEPLYSSILLSLGFYYGQKNK